MIHLHAITKPVLSFPGQATVKQGGEEVERERPTSKQASSLGYERVRKLKSNDKSPRPLVAEGGQPGRRTSSLLLPFPPMYFECSAFWLEEHPRRPSRRCQELASGEFWRIEIRNKGLFRFGSQDGVKNAVV